MRISTAMVVTATPAGKPSTLVVSRWLVFIACALPVIVLGLVLQLGVNIPFSDEWDWVPFLFDQQRGSLTLSELWRQHNEHRMIVSSLLVIFLAQFGGWNLIREEIVSVALCAGSQLILWCVVRRTIPGPLVPTVFLAMSLALWNLGQAENFAMGLQMGWFVVQLCVLTVVWRLSALRYSLFDILIAGTAATIASYSSEIGLLAWPVGFCAMILSRTRVRFLLILWIFLAVCVYWIFRIGFLTGGMGHVPIATNIDGLVFYSLAYLGVPLAYWCGLGCCILAGTAAVGTLIYLITLDLREAKSLNQAWLVDRSPWYCLALFAILGAIGTGQSRLGLGLDNVVTSTRYILISSWLTIAIIALVAMRFPIGDLRLRSRPINAGFVLLVISLATLISCARGIRDWQHFSAARRADLWALRSGHVNDVAPYYVHREILRVDIEELQALADGPLHP